MKKCPQCGRTYSDMVTMCQACNITLGNGQQPKTRQETVKRPMQETVERPVQETAKSPVPQATQAGPLHTGNGRQSTMPKRKTSGSGGIWLLCIALIVVEVALGVFWDIDGDHTVVVLVLTLLAMILPWLMTIPTMRSSPDTLGKFLRGMWILFDLLLALATAIYLLS